MALAMECPECGCLADEPGGQGNCECDCHIPNERDEQ